jgi:hypothetical protein
VHAEALAVIAAVTADFVFYSWDLEILLYYRIRHIPWCVRYHTQSLRLEKFEYIYVGRGCGSPELYSVGQDWFESDGSMWVLLRIDVLSCFSIVLSTLRPLGEISLDSQSVRLAL